MAEVQGYNGSITYSNLTANVTAWALSHEGELTDVTVFGDTEMQYIVSESGWTATIATNWDSVNTATIGDSAELTLTVITGSTYTGTAIIMNIVFTTSVDGLITAVYSLLGDGELLLNERCWTLGDGYTLGDVMLLGQLVSG